MLTNSPSKLFLSSFWLRNLPIRLKMLQVSEITKKSTCVIIPFAGYNTNLCFEMERDGLIRTGFAKKNIMTYEKLSSGFVPDYIYVPGGNPFKLLKQIREQPVGEVSLEDKIIDLVSSGRTIYIGVSAGAYMSVNNIEYVKEFEPKGEFGSLWNYEALGLISQNILCHANHFQGYDDTLLTIDDDQVVWFINGKYAYL